VQICKAGSNEGFIIEAEGQRKAFTLQPMVLVHGYQIYKKGNTTAAYEVNKRP